MEVLKQETLSDLVTQFTLHNMPKIYYNNNNFHTTKTHYHEYYVKQAQLINY